MKGKKILINACMVTNEPSGVGVYSIELLKKLIPHLEKNKFSYTIYCYNPALIEELSNSPVKKISLGYLLDKLLKKKEVIHRHIWNIIILNFLSIRFDILYSFTTHGTLFHPKQVITIHDLISLSFPGSHRQQYYYFKFFVPYLIKQSKHIITISNFTKDEVIKHYGLNTGKISVIYNGINHLEKLRLTGQDEKWVEDLTNNTPFSICVGASYVHKNIDTLLTICERMKFLKIKFIIINKPNAYYNSLKKQAADLNLLNVIFLPYITSSQLASLYKLARLNIYLSLYEGFGFPPAEAALFKTQSILSKHPALVEVYGEGFEYTDPFDIDFIEKIVFEYAFSEKKQLNHSYPELKKKYNWNKTAERTFELLETL